MLRHTLLATAAAAVVGFSVPSFVCAQVQDQPAGQRVDGAVDRATEDAQKQVAPDAEGIRDMLAQVTEASLTKGGFDDLVERFVDADRNRLGAAGASEKEMPTLDGRIAQFQKDWKEKYGQDFDINDEGMVFTATFAMIRQGEIPDSARLAGEREPGDLPRDPTVPRDDRDKVAGGDTNREPGRNIASVMIPASHGLPAVNVPLIHEAPDNWKIDVPDTLTTERLRENLLKQLTIANENRANWPADVNDAYRAVSHHVLIAVMDIEEVKSNDTIRRQPGINDPAPAPGQMPR